MMWLQVDGTDGVTHDDEATGYKRWDIVTCAVAEVDMAPVARDWQDATTGAYTSESVVPGKTMAITLTVTKGTHQNDDSEAIPAVPVGGHALYAVHVDGDAGGADVAGVVGLLDCTIPLGLLRKVLQPGAEAIVTRSDAGEADWIATIPGKITSTSGAQRTLYLFPPFSGNGEVKLLGVRITYKLEASSYVGLQKVVHDSSEVLSEVVDLSASLTMNSASQETMIDLRGKPLPGATGPGNGPIWGGGFQVKSEAVGNTGLVLKVASPIAGDSGGNIIYSVEWYFVGA